MGSSFFKHVYNGDTGSQTRVHVFYIFNERSLYYGRHDSKRGHHAGRNY